MQLLRHARAILVFPFTMVVLVPRWLLSPSWSRGDTRWDSAVPLTWIPRIAGVALIVAGFALFAWCVTLFARVGQGTLAPWDPTKRLVAAGPYRYLRNPMITGVVTMLSGLALHHGSRVLATCGPSQRSTKGPFVKNRRVSRFCFRASSFAYSTL